VNVIGYCLGGTLLGAALGVMAAKKDKRVASATFFVSLLDFSIPGELGVFIDEKQVQNLEKRMNERGFLEGSEMAGTFNMLRSNDLIWSFVVNNYLMGKDPFPFDLLHWNSDSTRMPAKNATVSICAHVHGNKLKDPGGISLDGRADRYHEDQDPVYFISTAEDHIAPVEIGLQGSAHSLRQGAASCSAARPQSPASSTRRRTSTATGGDPIRRCRWMRMKWLGTAARTKVVGGRLAGPGWTENNAASRSRHACPGTEAAGDRGRPGRFVSLRL